MLDELHRALNMLVTVTVTVTFWTVHLVTLSLRYQTHLAHVQVIILSDKYQFTGRVRVTDVS